MRKGSIRAICFKHFDKGLTIAQVSKKFGFNYGTVKAYNTSYKSWKIYGKIKKYRGEPKQKTTNDEMKYGTPSFTWESLEPTERLLTKQKNHNELKKRVYL